MTQHRRCEHIDMKRYPCTKPLFHSSKSSRLKMAHAYFSCTLCMRRWTAEELAYLRILNMVVLICAEMCTEVVCRCVGARAYMPIRHGARKAWPILGPSGLYKESSLAHKLLDDRLPSVSCASVLLYSWLFHCWPGLPAYLSWPWLVHTDFATACSTVHDLDLILTGLLFLFLTDLL